MTKMRTEGRNLKNERTLPSCCHLPTRTSDIQEERQLCQGVKPEGGRPWLLPAASPSPCSHEDALPRMLGELGWKLFGIVGLL